MTKKTVKMAIAYDFDGTLAPGNMQEHSFFPKLGIDHGDFWTAAKQLAKQHDMSEILAYMQLMLEESHRRSISATRKDFKDLGKKIKFFNGVEAYFNKINDYASTKGLLIDHYIISSGLRDIIEGTPIRKYFEGVFASGYRFDENDVATWPALAIDYTTKTQFLFRINKGINTSWDNSKINKFIPQEERPVPFSRMIYLGDGETDIPTMKMITYQGGTAIAVYNPNQRTEAGRRAKKICLELIEQERANYIAPADYTEGSALYCCIQRCIDKIAAEVSLATYKK